MPSRSGLERRPADYLQDGDWPTGHLRPDAPAEAYLAAAMTRRLTAALAGRSARSIARDAGISAQTVLNLLAGLSWGDVVTVARLERTLGAALW
ncbi:MAG: transcriptional regulator, partial [Actinomycetes bacterium]